MGCLGQKTTETQSQNSEPSKEEPLIPNFHSQDKINKEKDPVVENKKEMNNNNQFSSVTLKQTINVDKGKPSHCDCNDVVFGNNIQIKKLNEEEEDNYEYLVNNSKTLLEYSYKKVDISDKNTEAAQRIFREVEILKKIDHPNIIKFYEANISKDNKYIEVLTELPEDGDLQMRLEDYECDYKCLQESELLDWLNQMCFALKYIHGLHILHRNIKPSSIFLMNRGYAKLGDFGMAKIITKNGDLKRVKTYMPKMQFTAPEIFEKKDFTEKTDIWFLGVTFFQLMTFRFPFKGDNDKEKMKSILNEDKNDFTFSYSKDFKELITRMISKDPNKRPTPDEILEMPFIRKRLESYVDENENEFLKIQDDIFGQLEEIESGGEEDNKEEQKIKTSFINLAESSKKDNNKENEQLKPVEIKLIEGINNKDDNKKSTKKDKKKDDIEEKNRNDRKVYDKDDDTLDKDIIKTKKRFNFNEEEIKKKNKNNKQRKDIKSAEDFVKQLLHITELIKK